MESLKDPWTFRTLLRYKDHLNVYVRDELESLGLWEEEESVEDDALDSMSANVYSESSMNARYNSYCNSDQNCKQPFLNTKIDCWKKWKRSIAIVFAIKHRKLPVE